EQVQLLLQQEGIGAQRDELLALNDALDDRADLLVNQRLAARNRHHGGAAFVDGRKALLDRHAPVEDFCRLVDLAAAGAGEIAAEQRLEHQDERIALAPEQLLLEQIGAEAHLPVERYRHPVLAFANPRRKIPFSRYDVTATALPRLSSTGRRNSIVS